MFSPFHFHRFFREITGLPPARFHAALRMAEARRLLLQTGLPVKRIGERVGYTSPGTFGTQFARLAGLSPARFRTFVQGLGDERAGDDRSDGWLRAVGPARRAGATIALSGVPVHGSVVLGRLCTDKAAGGGDPGQWTIWTLGAGSGPGPVRLPEVPFPGDYAVLTVVVPGGVRLADALVDRPGSYLMGRARVSLPAEDQSAARVHATLRWPEPTDPPNLAITPIAGLVPVSG
jgi:hypothetical protein